MRNLKRVLSLALALIMVLGLMVMTGSAASADFDDAAEISYTEAVDVLTGLGVLEGDDTGSFNPTLVLTREQAAKIICYLVLGAEDAEKVSANHEQIFVDVAADRWSAGFIAYCSNLGYICGDGNGYYRPEDELTGVAFSKLLLVALGYDSAVEGYEYNPEWATNIAVDAIDAGIDLKGVLLSAPLTREQAAQMALQTLQANTVEYEFKGVEVLSSDGTVVRTGVKGPYAVDAAAGAADYDGSKDGIVQLCEKYYPELTKFQGPVTANEYANLYDTKALAAGRTTIDGVTYTNLSTTLEDIGETRRGWALGKEILFITNPGVDTIFETGAAVKDIAKESKLTVTGAEHFFNFDPVSTSYKASDWRIEYTIELKLTERAAVQLAYRNGGTIVRSDSNGLALVIPTTWDNTIANAYNNTVENTYTYTKAIKANNVLTSTDLGYIQDIFVGSDEPNSNDHEYIGEVYVGTKSGAGKDISDKISFKQFQAEYLETTENTVAVSGNENGNWLKVIDNDGDGKAEFVLKTTYTVSQVEKVDKKGAVTLATEDVSLNDGDSVNNLTSKISVVSEDELAAGDVVYYAVIDGSAYTYLADVVTAKIDKVNRNKLIATTTDGDEYEQSGVHNHTYNAGIEDGVTGLVGSTSYDLYLDKYGYLAAYTESTSNGSFVLLTDGWFASWKASDEYAVKAYIDGELETVDITKGGSLFVNSRTTNNWGQLKEFGEINASTGSTIETIVASLDDGTLTPVDEVYFYRQNVAMIDLGTTIPQRDVTNGTIYSTGRNGAYTENDGAADVRALSTTTYYYVYNTRLNTVVREYVGYANIPAIDRTQIEDVYVVGTRAENAKDTDYYTANIVVVELKTGYQEFDAETVFLADLPEVGSNVKIENAEVIRADGTVETIAIDLTKSTLGSYDPAGGKRLYTGLYHIWESDVEDVYIVDALSRAEIAAENFLVGTVNKNTATGATDWTSVDIYEWDEANNKAIANVDEIEVKNVESSNYYELSITDRTTSKTYYTGNLSESDRDTALAQNKDTKVKGAADTLNEVLISYNNKGEIIYAVSFNGYSNTQKLTVDKAQTVWENSIPAAKATYATFQPTVTKEGYELNFLWTLEEPVSTTFTTEVPYTVWSEWTNKDVFVITPATGNQIAIDNLTTFTKDAKTVKVDTSNGKQTIVVYSQGDAKGEVTKAYTFIITYTPAGTSTVLKSDSPYIIVNSEKGAISFLNGKKMSIEEFENHLNAEDPNAKVVFEYTNDQGTVTDKSQTLENVKTIKITVTAENKATQVYQLKEVFDAIELAAAQKVVDDKAAELSAVKPAEDIEAAEAALTAAQKVLTDAPKGVDTTKLETAITELTAAIEAAKKTIADEEAAKEVAAAVETLKIDLTAATREDIDAAQKAVDAAQTVADKYADNEDVDTSALTKAITELSAEITKAEEALAEQEDANALAKAKNDAQEVINGKIPEDYKDDEGVLAAVSALIARIKDATSEEAIEEILLDEQDLLNAIADAKALDEAKEAAEAVINEQIAEYKGITFVENAAEALKTDIYNTKNADALAEIYDAENKALVDDNALVKDLTDAIADAKDLTDARTAAEAALKDIFNAVDCDRTDEDALKAAYDKAVAAIGAAETTEDVAKELAAGIVAVQAFNTDADAATVSNADLAKDLLDAELELNDVVAALKDQGLSAYEIRLALYNADNATQKTDTIPALIANGFTAEEIFAAWSGTSDRNDTTASALKSAGLSAEDIVDGYVTYWASQEKPKGVEKGTVTLNDDGSITITVESGFTISDSDLFDVANAAGIETSDVQIARTAIRADGTSASYDAVTASYFNSQLWSTVVNNVTTNGYTYKLTVSAGSASIDVTLIADSAE